MEKKMFSIIVVTLNPGEKLIETIKSIESQRDHTGAFYRDYEILIKDGGSQDGCLEALEDYLSAEFRPYVRIIKEGDKSIYEGMNQATTYAKGDYFYFLNTGDSFASNTALYAFASQMTKNALLYYGDIYDALRTEVVVSNPKIDEFGCYRNVPCHQTCIYHRSLFEERGYETKYKVRGDYEHFLWSYFVKKANPAYISLVLASYEGGGYSETPENRIRSKREHEEITAIYFSKSQIIKYQTILLLTLAPLRTKMAESKKFGGIYQKLKKGLYIHKEGAT